MTELDAILRTIHEVEESLARRYARAEGTNLVIWGLVASSIFAFYQLVESNPAPYLEALGPVLEWVWLLPLAIGYAATMLVGARLGRLGADEKTRRAFRRARIPGALTAAAVVLLIVSGRYHLIYGAVPIVSGVSFLAFSWGAPRGPSRVAGQAAGVALSLVGLALLAWTSPWSSGIAAVAFLLAFGAVGTVRYRLGR